MKKLVPSLFVLIFVVAAANAQSAPISSTPTRADSPSPTPNNSSAPITITANSTPVELARAALAAQGGDKFKSLKSTWLVGSVDLYAPNSAQVATPAGDVDWYKIAVDSDAKSIPGKFSLVTAGERMRLDVDASPAFKFKQIFDGQQFYTSIPGVQTPPANKFGLMVLMKYDQPGYTVSVLPDKKKLRGFRIADAEGNTTDFYIDAVTGRVMQYLIPYNGYTFGIENTKFKEIDGVLIPFNFTQRLEMPQGAFFAEYHVKEAKLNQPLNDDVFVIQ